MKSKTSYFNKTIFKKNMTHFWPIWVLLLAWNLFVLPFLMYNYSLQYAHRMNLSQMQLENERIRDMLSLVEVYMNPILIFMFSVIVVVAVFHYLYNTRSAYTFHAFPVTRKELFVTNYISGLLFLIVPEIIGVFVGVVVGNACGYTSLNYLWQGMLFAIGLSFFFYSSTVFVTMFTGQIFAVPVFALVLNLLYVGGKSIVTALVATLSYGVPGTFREGFFDRLSPLYYIMKTVGAEYDYSGDYVVCKGLYGAETIIGYAVAAIVFILAAYFVYRVRNLETAGNLISIPVVAPIFRWGVAFFGAILLGESFLGILEIESAKAAFITILLCAVIFGVICFFGAQMFLEKGFRVFKKNRLIECGVFLGAMLILLLGIECDLFGLERKIPDVSEVEEAYIDCSYPVGGTEEDQIAFVHGIHEQMIQSKKEFENFEAFRSPEERVCNVSVKYFLKDGSLLKRSYTVPAAEEMLEDTNTVIGKMLETESEPDAYLKDLFGMEYQDIEMESGYLQVYDETGEWEYREFLKEDAEKIYQAVVADVEEGNFKQILRRRFYDNEIVDKSVFCSNMEFIYADGVKITSLYDVYNRDAWENVRVYSYRERATVGSGYVEFDVNCKHTIQALLETGVIQSEDELLTYEELSKLEEMEK